MNMHQASVVVVDGADAGDLLENEAQCLLCIMQHDGQALTSRQIAAQSVGRKQTASKIVARLVRAGYLQRAVVRAGSRHCHSVTQAGHDLVAELATLVDAARNGAPVDVVAMRAGWEALAREGQGLVLVGSAAGKQLPNADVQRAIKAGPNAARRMLQRLLDLGWVERVVVGAVPQYALRPDGLARLEELASLIERSRASSKSAPVASVPEATALVLLEVAAPVLKRGEWSGKAASSFHCPNARMHLEVLFGMGLAMTVCVESEEEPRWVPSWDGVALAERLRARRRVAQPVA